jgi:hypothetical protein
MLASLGALLLHAVPFVILRGEARVMHHLPRIASRPAQLFDVDLRAADAPMSAGTGPSQPVPARPTASPPTSQPNARPAMPRAARAPARVGAVHGAHAASRSLPALPTADSGAFAGGASAISGTGENFVPVAASPTTEGPQAHEGTADQTRPATLLGGAQWDCELPSEAEDEGVEHAHVELTLTIDAGGIVRAAQVLSDPGLGFAAEALRCARRRRFAPALDSAGQRTPSTQRVRVHF